jgi:putative molybdopterin biosynthesis protein
MEPLSRIDSFQKLKIIADPIRLAILRLLMISPFTLSQLGESLEMSAARIRHHLKLLENAGLVELVRTQQVRGFLEKYYRATSQAYIINSAVLPESQPGGTIYLFGSHDLALDLLSEYLKKDVNTPNLVTLPVGSLDGLVALHQGLCQLTGCHLYDPVVSEYNTPYVRHFFPGQKMHIVTLAHRQQGLLILPGNPQGIRGLEDLVREDVLFINRKIGSGTRLWLDQQLRDLNIETDFIRGYDREVNTHSQVASAVQRGSADFGLAVFAAARKLDLDFIPLFIERFDLVIPDEDFKSDLLLPALEYLHTSQFRRGLQSLGGYDAQYTGVETQLQ